jgi:hypothetical protein
MRSQALCHVLDDGPHLDQGGKQSRRQQSRRQQPGWQRPRSPRSGSNRRPSFSCSGLWGLLASPAKSPQDCRRRLTPIGCRPASLGEDPPLRTCGGHSFVLRPLPAPDGRLSWPEPGMGFPLCARSGSRRASGMGAVGAAPAEKTVKTDDAQADDAQLGVEPHATCRIPASGAGRAL